MIIYRKQVGDVKTKTSFCIFPYFGKYNIYWFQKIKKTYVVMEICSGDYKSKEWILDGIEVYEK